MNKSKKNYKLTLQSIRTAVCKNIKVFNKLFIGTFSILSLSCLVGANSMNSQPNIPQQEIQKVLDYQKCLSYTVDTDTYVTELFRLSNIIPIDLYAFAIDENNCGILVLSRETQSPVSVVLNIPSNSTNYKKIKSLCEDIKTPNSKFAIYSPCDKQIQLAQLTDSYDIKIANTFSFDYLSSSKDIVYVSYNQKKTCSDDELEEYINVYPNYKYEIYIFREQNNRNTYGVYLCNKNEMNRYILVRNIDSSSKYYNQIITKLQEQSKKLYTDFCETNLKISYKNNDSINIKFSPLIETYYYKK